MTAADARAWLVIAALLTLTAVVSARFADTHSVAAGAALTVLTVLALSALLAWARRRHLLDLSAHH